MEKALAKAIEGTRFESPLLPTPFVDLWDHYQEDLALCRRFGITRIQGFAWEVEMEQEALMGKKKKKGKGYGY